MVLPGIRLLRQGDKLGTSSSCLLLTEGGISDPSSCNEEEGFSDTNAVWIADVHCMAIGSSCYIYFNSLTNCKLLD